MTMSSLLADLPAETYAPPVRVDEFTVLEASRAEFDRLPESTRAEFDHGTVYMSPAPLLRHQDVVLNLARALAAYAEENGGYVGVAPDGRVPEPDADRPARRPLPRAGPSGPDR